jgi:MFS transporter, ACS family, tartrate transporter
LKEARVTTTFPALSADAIAPSAARDTLLASAIHKNAWRLLPLLGVAYFFNYIDRTNVGFAALAMNHDLGLTNTQFGTAAGLFFVGYCLLEVPSNLALYRFGARRWLARIMISWGILSAACALVQGTNSFYVYASPRVRPRPAFSPVCSITCRRGFRHRAGCAFSPGS